MMLRLSWMKEWIGDRVREDKTDAFGVRLKWKWKKSSILVGWNGVFVNMVFVKRGNTLIRVCLSLEYGVGELGRGISVHSLVKCKVRLGCWGHG